MMITAVAISNVRPEVQHSYGNYLTSVQDQSNHIYQCMRTINPWQPLSLGQLCSWTIFNEILCSTSIVDNIFREVYYRIHGF